MNNLTSIVAGAVIALCAASVCSAAMVYQPLEELTADSPDIIVGTVIETHTYWDQSKRRIYTDVTVAVDEAIKGNLSVAAPVVLTVMGGEIDGIGQRVSTAPVFRRQESAVLFLQHPAAPSKDPAGRRLTADIQGKFGIVRERSTAALIVSRSSGVLVDAASGAVTVERNFTMPLSDFLNHIRGIVRQQEIIR